LQALVVSDKEIHPGNSGSAFMAIDESCPSKSSFLLFVGLFFIVWTLRATLLYSHDTSIQSEALRNVYSNAVKFALWVLPVLVYLKKVDGKNPLSYLRITTPVSKPALLFSFIAIILYFSGVILLGLLIQGKHLSFNLSGVVVLSTSISSLFEEVLFRGFILNELREIASFRWANLIAALLFVLVHWPNWLWTRELQSQLLVDSLSIIILSCFLGYLVKRTNSLWPGVAAHIINNLLASILRP
jgi:membrane protease YdiL (CAAX protease family)